jgi:phospholipid/cholesterol/gamma-HCH transport system permease protein
VQQATIAVGASLDRRAAAQLMRDLDRQFRSRPDRLTLDLGSVTTFDSAGLGCIVEGMRRARECGVDVRLRGLSQQMLDFFSLLSIERLAAPRPAARRLDPVRALGALVEPLCDNVLAIVRTGAETLHALCVAPFRGQRLRLDRAAIELDACACGALPMIALIAFLLGLILAMQAYWQLRLWGAEIYMADMVGVGVMSEIGPLMTAIALAARSGSSNAAQLGAMVVGEEVDALRQMGIQPVAFLVLPKVLACAVTSIALTVIFDVVAMCGAALFAWGFADVEFMAFQEQLRQALLFPDFVISIGKSLAFGAAVGVIGCALGLRVHGGSEGVGRATTNAVVYGIFAVITIDALFVTLQRMPSW